MIKLYKKKFIRNTEDPYDYMFEFEGYFPKVMKTGYKKYYRGVWEADVTVKWDDTNEHILNNLKDYLFQIYDKDDEYIGAFIPSKPDISNSNKQSIITIHCNHALITLLDNIFPEELETDSEDVNELFVKILNHQKQKIWRYESSAHAEEAVDVKINKQSGLLAPFMQVASQLSPLYYFAYDTEGSFPWTVSLKRVTDTPTARIREGYNLFDYKLTPDPSNIYNRLYVYGEKEILGGQAKSEVKQEDLEKDAKAWREYQSAYKAWEDEQIKMQKARDAALKRRKQLVDSGARASDLPSLPPRPSTIQPPNRPGISSRQVIKAPVNIISKNPTRKPYFEDEKSIKTYGLKERILEFKDIADSEMLYNIGKKIFENRDNIVYDYSINATDLNKLLVKPIPFNWIRLGTNISFQTYRAGKAIEDNLIIIEESKQDIDGAPQNISLTLQLKNSASSPTVSYSTASQLLEKIEETEADIIKAYRAADGKSSIYAGKDQPPHPKVNDIWYRETIDDTGKPKIEMWIFDGNIWVNPFDSIDRVNELIEANEKELDAFDLENKTIMDTLKSDIVALGEDVNTTNNQIREEILAKTNELNEQLKGLDSRLSKDIKDKVDDINSTISTLEQSFKDSLDGKEAEILQKTKVVIDEELQTIKATIGKQDTTLDKLVTNITDITASLDGLSAKIIEVEASEADQNKKIAELDVSVNGIKSTVASLKETQDSTTKLINETKQTAEANKEAISKETVNREAAIKATNEKISTATSDISKLSETVSTNNETTTSKINEVVKDANSTKETIASLSSNNETRFNTIEKNVNTNTSTIASYKTKLDSTNKLATTNTTKIEQTGTKIQNIVTSYAKKTDLSGFVNEEQVTTIATTEAGKVRTTLSSQMTTIDNKVNGLKARPVYSIGTDGYWYKDGVKTDTLAKGVAGKDGADGGEFGWNLLLEGDTKIIDSTDYLLKEYTLVEEIPEGTIVSLVIRVKGKRITNEIRLFHYGGRIPALGTSYFPKEDSDQEFRTYVITGKWFVGESTNKNLRLYFGRGDDGEFPQVSVEWAKLVYGDNPTMEFAPARSEINGKIYASSTPPTDHNALWFNTNDKETYTYYNGQWYNINTNIKQTIHDVQDTVSSHTRTISTNTNQITAMKQDLSGFKTTVANKNYLSIINQQAGKQVFQVSDGKTTGRLMITPETVYIKDATINNAHISSLSASKLTSGTIDASKIRVINLDADDITSGTLSGGNVFWNLDEGTFLIGDGLENYEFWYDGNTLRLGNVDVDISHNETVTNIKDELKSVQENIQDSLTKEDILTDEELVERLKGKDGEDGQTPEIIDGMWAFGGESTGVKAVGEDGSTEILKAWASDISADNKTVSNFTLDESIGVTYKWVGLFTPRWRTSTQEMDTLRNDPKNYIWTRQNPKSVDLDIKSIQDITNDLKLANDRYKGQIEEINATVGGLSDGQQDAIRQIQETLASIEQLQLAENATAEEVQATNTLIDYVNNQLSSVQEGIAEGDIGIQELSSMLNGYIENLPQEIQSKLDNDEYIVKLKKSVVIDDNGISLSQEGSKYGINIDNEAMRFLNSGSEVAYINASRLFINEAEILSSIKIFNLIARKHVTSSGEKFVYFNWLDS